MQSHPRFQLFLLLSVALNLIGTASAEPEPSSDPVVAKLNDSIGRFFDGVAKGDVSKSYTELLKDSQLFRQSDALKALIDKTKEIEKKYGKYRGHDRIDAKRIGKDLILVRCLYKCDEFPVVWYFSFYHDFKHSDADNSSWIVVSVRFDTDLELLGM